ncbi:hypothetical protein Dimus_011818 [Dionaea muscipula]
MLLTRYNLDLCPSSGESLANTIIETGFTTIARLSLFRECSQLPHDGQRVEITCFRCIRSQNGGKLFKALEGEAEAIQAKVIASVDEAINTLAEALLGYGGNDVGIR